MPTAFQSACRERGVFVTDTDLEALHRERILVPLLRVGRDWAAIRRFLRREPRARFQFSHWQPTTRVDLLEAGESGRVFDPAGERSRSARERERTLDGIRYEQSVYLYSEHQLIELPSVKAPLAYRRPHTSGVSIEAPAPLLDRWREASAHARDVAIAASCVEQVYYPDIYRTYGVSVAEIDRYENWVRKLPATQLLRWLDVQPTWLKDSAAELLAHADRIDPLGIWSEVVARGMPDRWNRLRGDARSAMDLRVVAELLLLYYDRLARGRRAPALPPPTPRVPGPFVSRLKPHQSLDAVLTEFGISPHPSLVLVLEGDTEALLLPRVMAMFGIRREEDFISIQNAEGVGRDLTALAAFIAPRVALDPEHSTLDLQRPATRILVAFDPEGPVRTAADRRDLRDKLLDRIARALPPEHRGRVERQYVEPLVHIETWDRRGDSFEFAHFTDRQIARAILSVPGAHDQRTLADTVATVTNLRAQRGNLKSAVSGRKLELAEALWPVLHKRIRRASKRHTETRIPIIRVLDRALALANELPRRGLVIPLAERELHSSGE